MHVDSGGVIDEYLPGDDDNLGDRICASIKQPLAVDLSNPPAARGEFAVVATNVPEAWPRIVWPSLLMLLAILALLFWRVNRKM